MSKCKCDDCNELTGGDFVPGHDQKLRINLERKVGGLLSLKEMVLACEGYAAGKTSEAEVLRTIREVLARKTEKGDIEPGREP